MSNELTCPNCKSDKLLVYSDTASWINTDEHFCHSIKTHDDCAKVSCFDCGWEGTRKDVITHYERNR
jgi:hypothetical protein